MYKIESSYKFIFSFVVLFDSEKYDGISYVGDGEVDYVEICFVGFFDELVVRIGINYYINERGSKDGNIFNEEEIDDVYDVKGDID